MESEIDEQIEEGLLGRRPDGKQTHALQVPFLQPYRPQAVCGRRRCFLQSLQLSNGRSRNSLQMSTLWTY